MSENTSLVEYYQDLSIIQYADKPKARAMVGTLLQALICYDLAVSVRDGFNIDTAVGEQLDILAKYVGVSRVITGTAFTREYFGFCEYGDTTPFDFYPWLKYDDAMVDVQWRNYKESSQSLYTLNDEELRIIIKLAIVRNNSNASVKDIDELLNNLFGPEVYYIDRMNMTVVSYMLSSVYERIFNIAKSSGLLPNPAAVGTSLIVVPDINHIFAYSLYGGVKPTFAVGFTKYYWGLTFIAIGGVSRTWNYICSDPDGNIWATVFGGDIYKCPVGSTTFTAIGGVSRQWHYICSDPDGNIWATVFGGDIYKCIAGTTIFIPIGETYRDWMGICSDENGNMWANVWNGDIYKRQIGADIFSPIGETSRQWSAICSDPDNNIWATVESGDIYKYNYRDLTGCMASYS